MGGERGGGFGPRSELIFFVHATNTRRGRGTMRGVCSVHSAIASDHVQRARSNPWRGVWVERRFWQWPPSDY